MKSTNILVVLGILLTISACGLEDQNNRKESENNSDVVVEAEPTTFAEAFKAKQTKLRYLSAGASYTYGAGADGNSFIPGQPFDYKPGSGGAYTSLIVNKAEELDIFNIFAIDNLNIAVPGQTSGQILESQLNSSINYLKIAPKDSWTLAEVALGGNDLLGYLLFPRQLPSALTSYCFDVVQAPGRYGDHYALKTGPACDAMVTQILAQAEANLDTFVKKLKAVANDRTMIIVRNFDNPLLSTPVQYGGAKCLDVIKSPDLYGVSLISSQVERYLNGTLAKDGINGLNTVIANVAKNNGLKLADIRGALSGSNVFYDCVHPNQNGHNEIAKDIVRTVISK